MGVIRAHKSAGDMRSIQSSFQMADSYLGQKLDNFGRPHKIRKESNHYVDANADADGRGRKKHHTSNRWNSCNDHHQVEDGIMFGEQIGRNVEDRNQIRLTSKSVGDFLLQTSDYLSDESEIDLSEDENEAIAKVKQVHNRRQRQWRQRRRVRKVPGEAKLLPRRLAAGKQPAKACMSLSGSLSMLAQHQSSQQQQHQQQQELQLQQAPRDPGDPMLDARLAWAAIAHNSPVGEQLQRDKQARSQNDDVVLSIERPEAQGQDRHLDNAAATEAAAAAAGELLWRHRTSTEDSHNSNNCLAAVVVDVVGNADSSTEQRLQGRRRRRQQRHQLEDNGSSPSSSPGQVQLDEGWPTIQVGQTQAQVDTGAENNKEQQQAATVCCFCHRHQDGQCEEKCDKLKVSVGGSKSRSSSSSSSSGREIEMVDLSGAANKAFMGAAQYCSSWNLLNLHHHSSTYKVAEQQERLVSQPTTTTIPTTAVAEVAISGNNANTSSSGRKQQQENSITRASASQSSTCLEGGRYTSSDQNSIPCTSSCSSGSQRKVSHYSRPGRSPISLQRQTNARLARHRQKIQQQRQEQLASHLTQQRRNQESSFYLANGIYQLRGQRTQPCSSGNSMNHSNQLTSKRDQSQLPPPLQAASSSGSSGGRRGPDTSIEICSDNQLPLSSTSSRSRPAVGSTRGRTNEASVIVYKSINMLAQPNSSRSHAAYQPFFATAAGSGRSSGRYMRAERVDQFEIVDDDEDSDYQEVKTICSSEATSTLSLNRPFCKICHLSSSKSGDKLISPCRCSGTMQYIHCGCLLKWLEISNKTNEKPMSCELCAHEYTWHKKFNYHQLRLPKCSYKDMILHLVFVIAILAMLGSALAPVLLKKSHSDGATSAHPIPPGSATSSLGDQQQRQGTNQKPTSATGSVSSNLDDSRSRRYHQQHHYSSFASPSGQHHMATSAGKLANDEKFMLFCAASFFVSFFLAIYTQTKARDTLYGLAVKFLSMNQTYYITEFDHEQHNNHQQQQTNAKQQQQQQQQQQQLCNNDEEPRMNRKNSTAKS